MSGCHQHGPPHLSHPDCGFQPGSPERLSDCGLDESYREVTVDGAVEHSSGKGQAILRSCALSFLVNVVV